MTGCKYTTYQRYNRRTALNPVSRSLVTLVKLSSSVSSPQSQNQMKRRLLLNVVVTQSSSVFQLLSSKNQPLLIRWDSLLVLNLRLHVIDGIGRFDFESDGFTGESLNKNFASLLSISILDGELIPSECCNQRGFYRLQAAFQQR